MTDGGIRQNVFVETEDNCMSCFLRIIESKSNKILACEYNLFFINFFS